MIIRIRDDFECQLCGNYENSQVHHITPKAYARYTLGWHWSRINSIKNGILLCAKCHKKIHKKKKNNLPWDNQWDDYFKKQVEKNAERNNLQYAIC